MDADVVVRRFRAIDGLSFGNDVVRVEFDEAWRDKRIAGSPFGITYRFSLADAVTGCVEWLVPKPAFVELAAEYGLELMMWHNFHEYVTRRRADPLTRDAAHALWDASFASGPSSGNDAHHQSTLSADEWDAAYLYAVFAFRMRGSDAAATEARENRHTPVVSKPITVDDVLVLDGAA